MNTITQQGVYATYLRQNLGYPLCSPNPRPGSENGLGIGDVGYIDEYGQFVVVCNICCSPPPGGPQYKAISLKLTDLEDPNHPIEKTPIPKDEIFHGVLQDENKKSGVYKFTTQSDVGAILILPSGATRYELRNRRKLDEFQNLAIKHALHWCDSVRKNEHTLSDFNDSLYLITGLYKTKSWALGTFHEGQSNKVIELAENSVGSNHDLPGAYEWHAQFTMTHKSCSVRNNNYENQTVLIKGFKMTVRKAVGAIVVEPVDRWRSALSSNIYFVLACLAYPLGVYAYFKWLPRIRIGYYYPELSQVPALSQPPHYLDLINDRLLQKNPGAKVAISHDDVWINMFEKESKVVEQRELFKYVDTACIYTPGNDGEVVYLRSQFVNTDNAGSQLESPPSPPPSATGDSHIVITHIRVENVAINLGCVPVGFFVRVDVVGGKSTSTENKPARVYDPVIQWDDRIYLPSDPSTQVRLVICASFEFSPMLGRGEPLGALEIRICDLLDRTSSLFTSSEMKDPASPSLSLLISMQRWHCDYWIPDIVDDSQESLVPLEVLNETNEGQHCLLRYYNSHNEKDLKLSVEHFEKAEQDRSVEDSYRAAVLSNLAKVQFLTDHFHGTHDNREKSTSNLRRSLELRSAIGHPDRPMTLLYLSQALLYYTRGQETSTSDEIHERLKELKDLRPNRGTYEHNSAVLVLQSHECGQLADSNGIKLEKLISDLRGTALEPSVAHFDKAIRFNNLGLALERRFQLCPNTSQAAADIDEAVEYFQMAVQMTPDHHPDKPCYLDNLGNARVHRYQQEQYAVPITSKRPL